MKKIISAVTAATLICAGALPFTSSAAETPGFSMKGLESQLAESAENGTTIYINRNLLKDDASNTINAEVYVSDPDQKAWYVSPKWRCDNTQLKLTNILDPKDPENVAFAYAETDEDGNFIKGSYSTLASLDESRNYMGFTCLYSTFTSSTPLVPYGESSDSYPLTTFDIEIDPDIPDGDYSVYFLSEEDEIGQRPSEINCYTDEGQKSVPITLTDLSVVVYTPNDVDGNGEVSSADASAALAAYAKISSGTDSGLKKYQLRAADYDSDGDVTSKDASSILQYYAKIST